MQLCPFSQESPNIDPIRKMTDFFLSHDWGRDEVGRKNHDRVSKVNDKLKEMGFITWFDQEQLSGDIMDQMAKGIESTKV